MRDEGRARHRVVLADDASDTRLLLRTVLERSGAFEVVGEAADGDTATRLTREHRPDLLLLDLSMPGVDGFAVLSQLRSAAPGVAVVVHTGLDHELTGLGAEDGVSAYLSKDTPPDQVVARLLAVLGDDARRSPGEPPEQRTPVTVDVLARLGAALRFQDDVNERAGDADDVLGLLTERVCELLPGAAAAAVVLLQEDGLQLAAGTGRLRDRDGGYLPRPDLLLPGGLLDLTDPGTADALPALRDAGLRTVLAQPLTTARGDQGVVLVGASAPGAFTDHDRHVLRLLVPVAAARVDVLRAQQALAASERLYRNAVDGAPIGVALVALDGRFLQVNAALAGIVGHSRSELVQATFQQITHPDDLDADLESVDRLVRGEIASYTLEKRYLRRGGEPVWVRLHGSLLRDEGGRPELLMALVEDISELRRQQAELERLAVTDALSGLANRSSLMDRARHALDRLERRGGCVALLVVDLDHFKAVNDTLGHQAGDDLVRGVAARLTSLARPEDTVGRLGGDEFVVLLDDLDAADGAAQVGHRIVRSLARPFDVPPHGQVTIGCSVGVAVTDSSGSTPDELYRMADLALYQAKGTGRGRVQVFDRALRERQAARLQLEDRLRRALATGRLAVHYQPVVDLASGRRVAVEALVRLPGGAGGEDLVRVAEDRSLVAALDAAVLRAVLADLAAPQLAGLEHVSVDVAAPSLASPVWQQVARPEALLGGTAPVALEVTERALVAAGSSAAAALDGLRAAGVPVGLGGVGTGWSSLALLAQQELCFVKIDSSFVASLPDGRRTRAVVAGVVSIARELGLRVVADGVATPEQLDLVRAAGCERGQGVLLGAPVPLEAL